MSEELASCRVGAKVSGQVRNRAALLERSLLDNKDRHFLGIRTMGVETGDMRLVG